MAGYTYISGSQNSFCLTDQQILWVLRSNQNLIITNQCQRWTDVTWLDMPNCYFFFFLIIFFSFPKQEIGCIGGIATPLLCEPANHPGNSLGEEELVWAKTILDIELAHKMYWRSSSLYPKCLWHDLLIQIYTEEAILLHQVRRLGAT